MAELLFKMGRWSFRRKWVVLATWLIILGAVAGAAVGFSKPFSSQFSIGNAPSIEATKLMMENFPEAGNPADAATVNLVFATTDGSRLDEEHNKETIDDVVGAVEDSLQGEIRNTQRFGNPVVLSPQLTQGVYDMSVEQGLPEATAREDAENLALVSDDGRIAYTTFDYDVDSAMEVSDEQRQAVYDAMELGRGQGLQVEAGGAGFGDPIAIKATSEVVGLAVAFVVLLLTFGSLIAAGLPLITAVIGVGIGVLSILLTTAVVELNDVTPTLAIMIGLAVGIDYALFILSRYRVERERMSAPDAAGMAVGTAGSAVVFAAATVIIALAALVVAGIEFLSWMGLLAALTVAVAMLVALTLVPALLGIFGEKAFGARIPGVAGNKKRDGTWPKRFRKGMTMGRRWVTLVQKVPALMLAAVILGLGVLSLPVTRLEMALPSDTTSNVDTTQRKAADLMAEGFGAGVNAPLLFVVDAHAVDPDAPALRPFVEAQRQAAEAAAAEAESADAEGAPAEGAANAAPEPFDEHRAAAQAAYIYTVDKIDGMAEIKNAQLVGMNDDTTAAQVMITPFTGPEEQETVDVSHALRDRAAEIEAATGATVGMTGLTAVQMDITEELGNAMPLYLAIVVGLAIVLLLLVFRSITVPVVAGLGFLLSVGAAFGVTVLFWQEGLWGLVSSPGPLISFMPIFLIGVTFGLAMDYQMFLVSRMREHYTHNGGRAREGSRYNGVEESVIEGFSAGARVVTAAALIMIAVFVAFIDQPLPFIQIFGFALGAGVLFDAFFIRMTLVPATMFLMGRATWWIPRWLDRILPSLDVEGSKLEKDFEAGLIGREGAGDATDESDDAAPRARAVAAHRRR
ncbi:MMPL family transporter [Corynebacterium sp. MSK006]|uniref:MMPL family transporter n=1 Tax=Corynebacterium sp. MSK006 TaxID=3050187 RepID=UPI00255030DD|nr:MMPL family transporter [Corynebacterium sp. MSK006]MDK8896220.1 MMPL family transporter [Corynebacterium sp. MSK006]